MNIKLGIHITFGTTSVSCASPIVKLIFGAKSGEIKKGFIQGKRTKIHILEIE